MAKYLKNLEKHSLLARRKNNTASKMLEEKLKYLEQKFNREYRQYLRVKSRVQSELRGIEDVGSDYAKDKTTVPTVQFQTTVGGHHDQHYSRRRTLSSATNRRQSLELATENRKLVNSPNLFKHQSRPLNNSPNISNPFSEMTAEDGMVSLKQQSSKEEDTSVLSDKIRCSHRKLAFHTGVSRPLKVTGQNCHGTGVTVENISLNVNKQTKSATSHPRESYVWSSDILCRYNPHLQSCHCRHFPCVTPKTYHTIGQGSNEMNHVTDERVDSRATKLITPSDINEHQNSKNHVSSNPNLMVTFNLQNPSHKTVISTSNPGHHSDVIRLKIRPVNASGFSPMLTGPKLERAGSQPMTLQQEGSNRARVTIKDKIRGLKQMVGEMRAKNDQHKPRDWVVNYGEHFPPRILLNPVMP